MSWFEGLLEQTQSVAERLTRARPRTYRAVPDPQIRSLRTPVYHLSGAQRRRFGRGLSPAEREAARRRGSVVLRATRRNNPDILETILEAGEATGEQIIEVAPGIFVQEVLGPSGEVERVPYTPPATGLPDAGRAPRAAADPGIPKWVWGAIGATGAGLVVFMVAKAK